MMTPGDTLLVLVFLMGAWGQQYIAHLTKDPSQISIEKLRMLQGMFQYRFLLLGAALMMLWAGY